VSANTTQPGRYDAFLEALKAFRNFKKIRNFFISLITGTAVTSPRCYLLIALRVVAKGKQLPKVSSQSKIKSLLWIHQLAHLRYSYFNNVNFRVKYEVHLNNFKKVHFLTQIKQYISEG
jgi:hypothetical protein